MTGAVHHDAGRGTAYDLGLSQKHAHVAVFALVPLLAAW